MTTVSEIERAVAELPARDLAAFRAWFEAFEAERFDRRIADDVGSGKLAALAEEASADFATGNVREL